MDLVVYVRQLNLIWFNVTRCADDYCLKEVLKRLKSENVIQRRNAVGVISELICISSLTSHSDSMLSHLAWYKIYLLVCPCLDQFGFLQSSSFSCFMPYKYDFYVAGKI